MKIITTKYAGNIFNYVKYVICGGDITKKSKSLLSLLVVLILTLSFSTVSYAKTYTLSTFTTQSKNVTLNNANEQQIISHRSVLCPECGIDHIFNTSSYTDWYYTGHSYIWKRIKTVTYKCGYCSYGWTSTYEETEERHISTL